MNEVASSSTPARPNSASPPPKCAICLGTCTNKCFSDSCMHQFCFTCLLEWSKVKAECPLCKQPFKSIIHNIKSNDEYDQHVVQPEVPAVRGILGTDDDFLYLPPAAPSRHFQFRTTFTVDPGGELAIQQMLLTHPLTNPIYNTPGNYILPRQRYSRARHPRRASSATSFRRSIYLLNMWVQPPVDVSGRFRDISPQFYRENPIARNRLVPWLNRELNALLRENTQQVMHLVDIIMDYLTRWNIRSTPFRTLLRVYMGTKTDHFIHEFYSFMRSPFDMIGYDRHIIYGERAQSPVYSISDHDDNDSDVAIINIAEAINADNHPFRRPTIEVIEINSDSSHDSDVIIGETPVPEIVDLVDSDTTDAGGRTPGLVDNTSDETQSSEINRKPLLPLKIRLKHKRQSREKRSRNKKYSSKRHQSSTSRSSSLSSDSTDSRNSISSSHKLYKRKHKYKKSKRSHKEHKSRNKEKSKSRNKSPTPFISDTTCSDNEFLSKRQKGGFDTDDNMPLSTFKNKEKKKSKKSGSTSHIASSKSHTITGPGSPSTSEGAPPQNTIKNEEQCKPCCSQWKSSEVGNSYDTLSSSFTPVNPSSLNNTLPSISNVEPYQYPIMAPSYKYGQYSGQYANSNSETDSLPQFEHIPLYGRYQPYRPFLDAAVRYSPTAAVGSRYYDGPDYRTSQSYTPPRTYLAHVDGSRSVYSNVLYRNRCDCENSHRDCPHCNCDDNKVVHFYPPQNVDMPSRVNVGVGTSPIKGEPEQEYTGYYTEAGPSSGRRMQTVIVKKEEKPISTKLEGSFFPKTADSSDADN